MTNPEHHFASKYDRKHSVAYFNKHQTGFRQKLTNWREHAMAEKALKLAGNPSSVLDLPCGTGRFWDLLASKPDRSIYVADNSLDMIKTGMEFRAPPITSRITEHFQCSAFDIPKPDSFVENVFCIRLIHHIQSSEDRIKLLKELRRVTSDTVIFSLWVDGNYLARRHVAREKKRLEKNPNREINRVMIKRSLIEQEIKDAGLEIVGHLDFLKYYSRWRTYITRKI